MGLIGPVGLSGKDYIGPDVDVMKIHSQRVIQLEALNVNYPVYLVLLV